MIVEIIPNLWICNYNDIKKITNFYKDKNINLIINCSKNIPFKKNMNIDNIKLIRYDIEDDNKIESEKTYKINKLIYNYLQKNKGILCYCYEGTQCSPTLISTFFIQYANLEVNQITKSLQSKNKLIFKDNNNFESSLGKYKYIISKKYK